MANPALSPRELIEIIEKTQVKRERLPSTSFENGVPRSALSELCGNAKVEWLVHFIRDNASLKVLWIEENFNLLPTNFLQQGVDTNRIIFVEAKKDLIKVMRKALKCQIFDCIIAPSIFTEVRVLKVLQLLSEKSNTATILLGDKAKQAWPISLQLEINRNPTSKSFKINILKEKAPIQGSDPL